MKNQSTVSAEGYEGPIWINTLPLSTSKSTCIEVTSEWPENLSIQKWGHDHFDQSKFAF